MAHIDPRLYSQHAQLPPPNTTTSRPYQHAHSGPPPPSHHSPYDHHPVRLPSIHPASVNLQYPNPETQAQPYFRAPPTRESAQHTDTFADHHSPYSRDQAHQRVSSGGGDGRRGSSVSPAEDGPSNDPNDPKRARACESCRGLKVRCDQEDSEKPCKRCAKAKRECIVTQPSRKRQKKPDGRVAELERKIDALTATLHAQADGTRSIDGTNHSTPHQAPPLPSAQMISGPDQGHGQSTGQHDRLHASPKRRFSPQQESGARKRIRSKEPHEKMTYQPPKNPKGIAVEHDTPRSTSTYLSSKISDIISDDGAAQTFQRYVMEMAVHMPAVVFPPRTTAEEVRANRPVSFLSILVAGSLGLTPLETQEKLAALLLDVLADSIVRNGEKSLDLIQALLVATIWYRPPKHYEQMNFYQLGHIAAVMAIDMGMGKRSYTSKTMRVQPGPEQMRMPNFMFNSESVEARRTWLVCYFNCTNTSMTLRRPALIRWTKYMSECIEILDTSEARLETDILLCQHVKLQHMNEMIGAKFSMHDSTATVTISDMSVQVALKTFETQMQGLIEDTPKTARGGKSRTSSIISPNASAALIFSQQVSRLYMHEIALHINHNVDDFRAPFTEESLKAASGQSVVLSPAHSSAILECLSAVHGIFDTFFAFDVAMIRALPIVYFVRVAYAVVVLIKLHFAITAPGSEVGKIVTKEELNVEHYLDNLLGIFIAMADDDAFRPNNKFLMILGKLREWFQKNKESKDLPRDSSRFNPYAASVAADRVIQPDKHSSVGNPMQQQERFDQQQTRSGERQQQQIKYDNSTPLHFLSDVATTASNVSARGVQLHNNAIDAVAQQYPTNTRPPHHQQQQSSEQAWYAPHSADTQAYTPSTAPDGGDFGMPFEQAMDMTLGTGSGNADLSSFFMDPMFNFGTGFDASNAGAYWQPAM